MGQAIPPISAVINRFELARGSLLLLPKWEGGLGPRCPKSVCPPFKPSGLFWKLHFWNQETKLQYLHYQLCQYIDFHLDSISSLVWFTMWKIQTLQPTDWVWLLNILLVIMASWRHANWYWRVQTTKIPWIIMVEHQKMLHCVKNILKYRNCLSHSYVCK